MVPVEPRRGLDLGLDLAKHCCPLPREVSYSTSIGKETASPRSQLSTMSPLCPAAEGTGLCEGTWADPGVPEHSACSITSPSQALLQHGTLEPVCRWAGGGLATLPRLLPASFVSQSCRGAGPCSLVEKKYGIWNEKWRGNDIPSSIVCC